MYHERTKHIIIKYNVIKESNSGEEKVISQKMMIIDNTMKPNKLNLVHVYEGWFTLSGSTVGEFYSIVMTPHH